MDQLISKFPDQVEEAMVIGKNARIRKHIHPIHKVLVAGMGGSGIGGDFVASFIRNECRVPYLVSKGYHVPAYTDEHTLFIASSYSGNTEETLSCYRQLKDSGAKIVFVSSGGELSRIAEANSLDFIRLPGDWPSPRACLGYSIIQQLYILHKLGLISDSFESALINSVERLRSESDEIKRKAENVASFLHGKTAVIYAEDRMEPVAVRFRQQLNENAKVLAWHHVIPEMNHNELVGWKAERSDLAVVVIRNRDDYQRNQSRIAINKEIISRLAGSWIELYSRGSGLIEQSLYLVHLVDWVSWYLSVMRGVDAVEIDVIDYLKSELSKQDF